MKRRLIISFGIALMLLGGIVAAQPATPIAPTTITPENADQLREVYTLERHRRAVTTVVFTEEYALNTTGMDNWWYVWDLREGRLSTPQRNVYGNAILDFAVEVDPEEEVINALVVQQRGRNRVVVATTTNQLLILTSEAPITDVALKNDMSAVATAAEDNSVTVRSVESGENLASWTLDAMPMAIRYSETGDALTAITAGGVYQLREDDPDAHPIFEPESGIIISVDLKTDAAALVLDDGTVMVVETATGEQMGGFTAPTPPNRIALASGKELVALVGDDDVMVYDLDGEAPLITLAVDGGIVTQAIFSPEDIWLVVGTESGWVHVYGLQPE